MPNAVIRVGIVGAGANTREKHIPLLQAIPGVEVAEAHPELVAQLVPSPFTLGVDDTLNN